MLYQIISSFVVLGQIVFIPLGTYLSGFIATEFFLIAAGILFIVSIIPLCLIKESE